MKGTLDSQLAGALLEVKRSYYGKNEALFEAHFAGMKVGQLDSDGKLSLIADDLRVDLLNARFCTPVKNYMQAFNRDVRMVVFVSAGEYASAAEARSTSTATPDILTPATDEVSSVTVASPEPKKEPAGVDESLEVEMTWSGDYDQVVQPERIIAIPRYFLRHISRMGVENAWLYVGFRQAAYQVGLHHGIKKVDIPSRQIARWAGIHQATFWRRFAKEDTWKALNGFVVKVKAGDWKQDKQDGRPHQAPNRYKVSMTVPLTPRDVCSLRSYLINLAEGYGIEAAVECALAVPPEDLLPPGNAPGNCDPMTVYELVTSLGGSSKAASALQAHVINYQDILVITQFFVETWLPRLGEAASWMIVWMRDTCDQYGNFRASVQEIMDLTGMNRERTVRNWLRNKVVCLFLTGSPDCKYNKARGRTAKRSFLVKQDEPLEHELVGDATHRKPDNNDELVAVATHRKVLMKGQLVADATHRSNSDAKELVAVVKNELVADATHRENGENGQLVAVAIHRRTPKRRHLVAVATHRREDSPINWSLLRYRLVANATVKALINKESTIKLIKETTTTNYDSISALNARAGEGMDIPCGSPEATDFQEVVGESGIEVFPENDSGEEVEIEPVDPQQLFHQILKHANVTPKIQQRFRGKPFYPFLCWLIYGASRESIDDPVGFAISRYDLGLPDSQEIKDLARDLGGLLDDLDYFKDFFTLMPSLRQIFGENAGRVRLLAQIIGD